MSLFESALKLFNTALDTANDLLKLTGAIGQGDFAPAPGALQRGPARNSAGVLQQDPQGALLTRSTAFTDEGAFRDDFVAALLLTNPTGTVTFTNNSKTVTAAGSNFLTSLNSDMHIKRAADAETNFVRIATIIDDNTLELDSVYPGATGTGVSTTFWPTVTGPGVIGVGASLVSLQPAGVINPGTRIFRKVDYLPLRVVFGGTNISARNANQETIIGFVDVIPTPVEQAVFVFDGVTNTVVKCRSSASTGATNIQETTVTFPNAQTSNLSMEYTIELGLDNVTFLINGIIVAVHRAHLPRPYTPLLLVVNSLNTAATVTTILSIDVINVQSVNRLGVQNQFLGDGVSAQISEETHYHASILNTAAATADQIVTQVTVPTGKTLHLLGWSISSDTAAVTGVVKIGKNVVTTEPVPAAVPDGNFFRTMFLPAISMASEDYAALPRKFAKGGDVVTITVTPSAATPTNWRGSLLYVLR